MKIQVVSETTTEDVDYSEAKEDGQCSIAEDEPLLVKEKNRQVEKEEKNAATAIVTTLINHFRQSIHHIREEPLIPHFIWQEHGDMVNPKEVSSIVLLWRDQLLQSLKQQQQQQQQQQQPIFLARDTMVNLLQEYLHQIRNLLFSISTANLEETVPVLVHFELLVTSCCDLVLREEMNHTDGSPHSHQEASLPEKEKQQVTAKLAGVLRILSSDITLQISKAIQLRAEVEADAENNNNDNAKEQEFPLGPEQRELIRIRYLCTSRILIPLLLRLVYHCIRIQKCFLGGARHENCSDDEWNMAQAHVAMTLLSFRDVPVGLRTIFPESVDRIEHVLQYVLPVLSTLPSSIDLCATSQRTKQMNWSEVELSSQDWDEEDTVAKAAMIVWKELCSVGLIDHTMAQNRDRNTLELELKDWLGRGNKDWNFLLAQAARAHFFGRDLYTIERQEDDSFAIVPRTPEIKTVLHLGRTVIEETKSYEKPYQEIPSRVFVLCRFVSLLDDENTGVTCMNELWPVIYELLNASREVLVAMGAACLCRLLQVWKNSNIDHGDKDQDEKDSILANMQRMLARALQICRGGAILATIGLAQQELYLLRQLRNEATTAQLQEQVKSTQQWLTVLHQNHTLQLSTSWGCLVGGILPLLHSFWLTREEGEDVSCVCKVGRLGLQALLPLISMDHVSNGEACDEGTYMFVSSFKNEVQWMALLAFSTLLEVVSPDIPQNHGGKIMSAILICLGLHPKDERVRLWAHHISMIAYQSCGTRGTELLQHVQDNGYQDDFVNLAGEIEKQSV